jgi:hypothetical protein
MQSKTSSTPVYAGKNFAGSVNPLRKVFEKSADSTKHLVLKPWRAWAFDLSVLREAAELGATWAQVYDRATGLTYRATFETIYKHGFSVNRGYGDQLALALDHWSIDGAAPLAEQRAAETNEERGKLQMSLFAEVAQ